MAQDIKFFKKSSYIFSLNAVFIEELYERYLERPDSVDDEWHDFFKSLEVNNAQKPSWSIVEKKIIDYKHSEKSKNFSSYDNEAINKNRLHGDINNLINLYRSKGHFCANIDPLNIDPVPSKEDIGINLNAFGVEPNSTAKSIADKMDRVYCGKVGYEFSHIDNTEQLHWLHERVESFNFEDEIDNDTQQDSLETLLEVETFEQFLHSKFPGAKRFSIEGAEASIIAVRKSIRSSVSNGVEMIILGMPHRGRLSMLTKVVNKPYHSMFSEFQGNFAHPEGLNVSGDVKYHLGISSDIKLPEGNVHISLTPNPSHLEAVNPVVAGKVRAKQDIIGDKDRKKVMGILLHGDAAFAGQGVVMESLMLGDVDGYNTGGILHIVVNNQVGFTADASDARSTRYPTEIAKIVKAPIFHVNGNSIKDVLKVSKIASEFRSKFGIDVVIDIVCYRLHGHNEIDEPRFTQPLMYKNVESIDTPGKIYCDTMVKDRVVSDRFYNEFKNEFKNELEKELEKSKSFKQDKADWLKGNWSEIKRYVRNKSKDYKTGVALSVLKTVVEKTTSIPETISTHKIVQKGYMNRKSTFNSGSGIDWATAEMMAFGSLLAEGTGIRFTGQDSKRGTFSQRHSVIVDQNTAEEYIPLNNISDNQAKLEIIDSFLSEFAVMGFEYGYSTVSPKNLVLWEAQFGDFSNGAQIVIDQFISSAEEKWLRMSGLILLLPHGYEGQGPEHSSARLERYLQLCAKFNMQVVNCSTPANYFHVLRRQIHRDYRKPLVVMTPKSLLRHKKAVSKIEDFITGTEFQPVIVTNHNKNSDVTRLIICSGKVYYDLLEGLEKANKNNVVLLRLEQFYPFPEKELSESISKFDSINQVVFCQEEPHNMGAWGFVKYRLIQILKDLKINHEILYAGRVEAASTAAGYPKTHSLEQDAIIKEAIG